jgi:hypothetical protein
MWIIIILGPKREEVMGGWRKLYNGIKFTGTSTHGTDEK